MASTQTGLGSKEVLGNPELLFSSLELIPSVRKRIERVTGGRKNVMTATQGPEDRRLAYIQEAKLQLERADEAERVAAIEREAREVPPAPTAQVQDLTQLRAFIAGISETPRGEG